MSTVFAVTRHRDVFDAARKAPGIAVGFFVWVAVFMLPPVLRAAPPPVRDYDLPAGDAAATLQQFVEQSGEQVFYLVNSVRGVRTNPVRGRFPAREALDRMLASTSLIAVQDAKSDALMVRSAATTKPPKISSHFHPSPTASPDPPAKTMKRKKIFALLGSWLALALSPGHASDAQAGDTAGASRETGAISGRVENVATGQYLNNARVSVRGTNIVTFTDQFGMYRLVGVPTGRQVLEVFYTDLDPQEVRLEVLRGGGVEQNVSLTSVARYGHDAGLIRLNPYVVSSNKDTDAQSIAINEQRFAPNIKNVMAADELGDVLGSSVGEFLKFIPGLTVENDYADITGVSIRGIGGNMTSVTTDGVAESTIFVSATRSADLRSMALNDISRIEVTKVPTPATPADSLAGSVNMVSKSAFERSGRLLRYGINLVGNSENLTLKKTPHPYKDRRTYKILPGFNFDYTLPVTKDFGVVVTAMHNTNFNEQHYARKIWASTGTGTGASVDKPYLQQFRLNDGPRNLTRQTLGVRADWRVTPNSVLSLGTRINRAETQIGGVSMTFSTGSNGTSTPSSRVPMSYGPDFTIGATGRGSVTMGSGNQRITQDTDMANLSWRFDDGRWKIDANLSRSTAVTRRHNAVGSFLSVEAVMRVPVRVSYLDITDQLPRTFQVFDANSQPVDLYDIENYRMQEASSVSPSRNERTFESGSLNVRRRLDIFPFPSALQAGAFRRVETVDMRPISKTYTFNGPGGNPLASITPYLAQVYKNMDSYYGFKNVPWISSTIAAQATLDNPALFTQSAAQLVTTETNRITNSEFLRETITSFYLQAEAKLLGNRLQLLTGVRHESTYDQGKGALIDPNAVWVRNSDGTFARDGSGNRIRKTEAGASGSMEQLRLTHQERASETRKRYDGNYPSFHANYGVTENFLVRAAYAKTYGRPDFANIIPRTTVNEANLNDEDLENPTISRGTLTVRNPALKPWTADNYDLSFEYYSRQGGLFSAGVFLKEIEDFFGTQTKLATLEDLQAIGYDSRYVGWTLSTTFNSGDARVSGVEFNVRHSLRALGRIGSYFTVFANYTHLELDGHQQASFTSFVPKSGNWGASFNAKRFSTTLRWNYRGQQQRAAVAAFGSDGFEYYKARITMDMNLSYQLTRRLSLAASVTNVFNERQILLRYGSETPHYAREYQQAEFGVQMAVGIKGTF